MAKILMLLATVSLVAACGGNLCAGTAQCVGLAECTTANSTTPACGVGLVCCAAVPDAG